MRVGNFAGGAMYVRWGRKTCPDTSELIYGGAVGGSYYTRSGGGSNYLCLPLDPIYGNVTPSADKLSRLHGAEYENPTGFTLDNAQSTTLQDENVPCAVCVRVWVAIITLWSQPGDECYPGWTQEYDGFLVSGANVHAGRTEFLCMDRSPETMTSGYPDQNGVLFYNVAGTCGSLPCPPYVENYELTCVVCTK